MKNTALKVLLTAAVLIPVAVYAQPRPGNPTTATVITKAEIDKISATEQSQRTRDENARVVDIGDGWSMELGIIHRASTRNPPPAPAAGAGKAAAQTIPCGEQMVRRRHQPPGTSARRRRRRMRCRPGLFGAPKVYIC